MKKTIEDYMNDPEIANEPSALREVHAIRLKIYDEIKDMTSAEITDYYHEGTKTAFARLGITPKYTSPYREDS
jgi:Zn/Cd-binding protein ZinT